MQYKLDAVSSDRLYFDQYNYTACLALPGASALRGWRIQDESDARNDVSKRWAWRAWRNQHINVHGRWVANVGGSWRGFQGGRSWPKTLSAEDVQQMEQRHAMELTHLMEVFELLRRYRDSIKCTFSLDLVYMYFNDLEVLNAMANIDTVSVQYARKARVDRPRDVLLLNEPTHSHRSYFREKWLPEDQSRMLRNWLGGQQQIRLSPSLYKWLHRDSHNQLAPLKVSGCYVPANWFIDHDNSGELLMLEMVIPRLIRKTLEIQKR